MAETSKKRTVRIPLDYYKRPDPLSWWKRLLSALAVLLAAAWVVGIGWDFWSPARRQERMLRLASHGPLARAHATWETQCDACHAPFRPIADAQSNAQCRACHAGNIHHARQQPSELACASCHRDHQGVEASLVRHADSQCTQCHADLTAHVEGGETGIAPRVTRFDDPPGAHPEFQDTDPGHLKFDHARHLTLGMGTKTFGPVQTLELISAPDRARYEKYARGSAGWIELDCAACHELVRDDLARPAPVPPPPRRGPAYMLPVTYQAHCRACHPLSFDPSNDALVMEHPLQPAEVDASLWRTYIQEYLKQNPAVLDQRIPPRPLPGQAESPALIEARAAVERKVSAAEKILFGPKKCAECHEYQDAGGKTVAALDHWDPAGNVSIAPTQVPVVWWGSAAFTHTAHRGVSCRGCHERAFADSQQASHESKDVLLPARAICLQCHAPRRHGTGTGGASFDCTECHRYHDGDAAVTGRIRAPASPDQRLTIEQFLLGTKAPGTP
jgi:hypothetical protein